MYETIRDLPIVCQLNLPEPALLLYRDAFNREYTRAGAEEKSRYLYAQTAAWMEVRKHFERDRQGIWKPR